MEETSSSNLFCGLCTKSFAKYTCPRCRVRYCSSECYRDQSHLQCSELFYRKCFMDAMQCEVPEDNEKQRMMHMIKQFEEENAAESEYLDDEAPDLAERISGIDLDDPEKVLQMLTPKEIEDFEAQLKAGRTEMIELWNPWWCVTQPFGLEEVSQTDQYPFSHLPPLMHGIEDINNILKTKQPSKTIPYDILNTLYGYAYVSRFYNGDHCNLPLECAPLLMSLSLVFQQMQFFEVATTLGSGISCVANHEDGLFVSNDYSVAVIDDVLKILAGPNSLRPLLYVMTALSDCHKLFQNYQKTMKKTSEMKKKGTASQKKQVQSYYSAQKKLEFYFSWVQKYGLQLQELIPQVELEICSMSSDLAQMQTEKETVQQLLDEKKSREGRRLIEEL